MHRRLFYIYLLNVPSFSSRYFNKTKLMSRLGRLLALSLEILSLKSEQKFQSYRCRKICIKCETCFHSHFYANFQSFYNGQLKQQICYSFIWCLNYLKWRSSSFSLHQNFQILMVQMLFPQIQQSPGPNFRKVGKSMMSLHKHAVSLFSAWTLCKSF